MFPGRFAVACCVALLVLVPGRVVAQSDSLRTGYVIVTPTFGDQSRLSAFETFRFSGSASSSQASVIDSILSTNSSVFVSSDNSSGRYFGLALVNPGSGDAQVTLRLYRGAGGVFVDSTNLTVHAREQISRFITEIFSGNAEVQSGFAGLLNVTSTSAIGIVGLRFRYADFSTVPLVRNLPLEPVVPFQSNGAGGPGAVLFPHFATGTGWTTEIVLSNTSLGPISVRVDAFDDRGVPISLPFGSGASPVTISPNGVAVLTTAGAR